MWRAKAGGCPCSLRRGVWTPGVSPPANVDVPHPFAKPKGFFLVTCQGKSWGCKAISITTKTLLCKMSICLFKGIFRRSNLNCAVKCQERVFNEDQLEALIGWVFNGRLFLSVVVLSLGLCFHRDPR